MGYSDTTVNHFMMFKAGLVSISFRQNSVEEIIAAASAAGLSLIEWGSDVHAPCTDLERIKEIRGSTESAGLRVSSYGTYFRIGKNTVEELLPYIEAAKALGTDILRLWCGTKGYSEYTDSEKTALYEECRALASLAKKSSVVLCMECHNGTFTDCLSGANELMERVSSDAFRMYWQPNQFKSLDENLEYARVMAPYTKVVHVFNWEGNEKYPLCEAEDTWKKYLSFFSDETALLLEFMPDGRIESLDKEAGSLLEIISQI